MVQRQHLRDSSQGGQTDRWEQDVEWIRLQSRLRGPEEESLKISMAQATRYHMLLYLASILHCICLNLWQSVY